MSTRFSTAAVQGSFAREISGLRLWEPLQPAEIEALRNLLSEHGVLVFRRQALSEHEFAEFCALFGTLEQTARRDWAALTRPEINILSNLRDGAGKPIGGLSDGELDWHSDQSYVQHPATGGGLYAVEIAHQGGATRWANLGQAYAALPEALRRRADTAQVIYSYAKRLAGYSSEDKAIDNEVKRKTPAVTHPLVLAHPLTGRKALYLDPTTAIGVVGMPADEAGQFLAELVRCATAPGFVYAHAWQVGDVLLWDNGFLLHQRDAFPESEHRLMKRATFFLPPARHMVPGGEIHGMD